MVHMTAEGLTDGSPWLNQWAGFLETTFLQHCTIAPGPMMEREAWQCYVSEQQAKFCNTGCTDNIRGTWEPSEGENTIQGSGVDQWLCALLFMDNSRGSVG